MTERPAGLQRKAGLVVDGTSWDLGLPRMQVKEAVVGSCLTGSLPQDKAEIPHHLL